MEAFIRRPYEGCRHATKGHAGGRAMLAGDLPVLDTRANGVEYIRQALYTTTLSLDRLLALGAL